MNVVAQRGSAGRSHAIRVMGVDHTSFTVASLERSLMFWVDVLGFRLLHTMTFEASPFVDEAVGVPGAALRLAMVQGPGHVIELLEFTAPADRQTLRPRSCDVGSAHVALNVENIDAVLERIAVLGWRPVGKTQTVGYGERRGLRFVYVRDPDGIMVEFLQPPANGAVAVGEEAAG